MGQMSTPELDWGRFLRSPHMGADRSLPGSLSMDDPKVLSVIVSVIGLLLNAAVIVVGAVWAIGKINTQVAVFSETIRALRDVVTDLQRVVIDTDKRVDRHEVELARIREQVSILGRVPHQQPAAAPPAAETRRTG